MIPFPGALVVEVSSGRVVAGVVDEEDTVVSGAAGVVESAEGHKTHTPIASPTTIRPAANRPNISIPKLRHPDARVKRWGG